MLKKQYAKNTYGLECQNTHGPKLWLLDTWAWAAAGEPLISRTGTKYNLGVAIETQSK